MSRVISSEATTIVRCIKRFLEEPMKVVDLTVRDGEIYNAFLSEDPSAVGIETDPVEFGKMQTSLRNKPNASFRSENRMKFLSKVHPGTYNVIFFDPDEDAKGALSLEDSKDFVELVSDIANKDLATLIVIKATPRWDSAIVQKKLKKRMITTVPIVRNHIIAYYIHIIHN